jgi:hypothetical protein
VVGFASVLARFCGGKRGRLLLEWGTEVAQVVDIAAAAAGTPSYSVAFASEFHGSSS